MNAMHNELIQAVFALSDSIRASALEIDRDGNGEIDASDHNLLLKLLTREMPELVLPRQQVGALASAFEGEVSGSIIIDSFLYSLEQNALRILSSQPPSAQQVEYEQYEQLAERAEAGRGPRERVIRAPTNTSASVLLRAIQRKLRSRSGSGVSTENKLFLDMDTSRTGRISVKEMIVWFEMHGLGITEKQLFSVLDLIADSTRDRGRHAFQWEGGSEASIGYHGFDNLIAGLLLPAGSTGRLFAPAPWERADRYDANSAAARAQQRFLANARARAREALAAACNALAHEAWSDTELLLALSRKLNARNTSLVDAFRKADSDGSGLVSAEELAEALAGLDLGVTVDRATTLIRSFDRTGNGKVACFEFIRMVNSSGKEPADRSIPLAVEGKSCEGKGMGDSKEQESKQDYTNAPPSAADMSDTSLAAADRDTLIEFRQKLEDDRVTMRKAFQKFDTSSNKTVSPQELREGLSSLGIELDDYQAQRLTQRFDLEGDGRLHYFEFVKLFHGLPPSSAY